jgi:two-component system sensor histidine kinase and response regulator WspE
LQAADGIEAWGILQNRPVDLVLTDVEMPGMGGLELSRRIRECEKTARLPVVAVSHRVADEDLEEGFLAGMDAYIRKDRFSQRELGATLRGLLGSPATVERAERG